MSGISGLEVLREIRKRGINIPVLMITAHGTIETAVQAMREGAYDFIPKPFEPSHLGLIVQRALERENLKKEVATLSEEVSDRHCLIVGTSSRMSEQLDTAKKAASSSATVLLLGESGMGKELLPALFIIGVTGLISPLLPLTASVKGSVESELFGHEKRSFTGAHQQKKGR
jgi:DNA-binding NtrC family response regulator